MDKLIFLDICKQNYQNINILCENLSIECLHLIYYHLNMLKLPSCEN